MRRDRSNLSAEEWRAVMDEIIDDLDKKNHDQEKLIENHRVDLEKAYKDGYDAHQDDIDKLDTELRRMRIASTAAFTSAVIASALWYVGRGG